MEQYDFIVVGTGIAGLYTALQLNKLGKTLIVTKGSIEDCNTRFAQGGIAAAIGKLDSPEVHFRDTVSAGVGLCDEEAVRIMVQEAPARISDLVRLGVPFDTLEGEIALALEAAHSQPRILHAGGDATGEHIEVTLSRRVQQAKVRILEDSLATEVLLEGGRVAGINVLNSRTGSFDRFGCKYLVLATGGAGQQYEFTTNSEVATGDGIALAFQAGAEIISMEFFQFHPTALRMPGVTPFLITEAVRGEGGVLRNASGHRFMPDYAPEADLAPRDVTARSILYEMNKTGTDRVFLDVTHLSTHIITTRFPHVYRFCLDHGLDITREPIPVAPAAHYMIGGIKTDVWGETTVPGLFAAGETACTGVHGANRLASNSLLEAVVYSKRIADRIGGQEAAGTSGGRLPERKHALPERTAPERVSEPSLAALQQLQWDKVGIIRDRERLEQAAGTIAAWQKTLPEPAGRSGFELRNLLLTARLVAESALIREESRGAHFRKDFPQSSHSWRRYIVLEKAVKG